MNWKIIGPWFCICLCYKFHIQIDVENILVRNVYLTGISDIRDDVIGKVVSFDIHFSLAWDAFAVAYNSGIWGKLFGVVDYLVGIFGSILKTWPIRHIRVQIAHFHCGVDQVFIEGVRNYWLNRIIGEQRFSFYRRTTSVIVEVLDPCFVSVIYSSFICIEELRFPSEVKSIFHGDIPLDLVPPGVVKVFSCAFILFIDTLLESWSENWINMLNNLFLYC